MSAESYSEPIPEAPESQLMNSVGEDYRNMVFNNREEDLFLSSAAAERKMLRGFYGYCEANKISLRPEIAQDQQALTEATHNFIADAIDRKISQDTSNEPGKPPFVIDAPRAQIKKIYDNYYEEFNKAYTKNSGPVKERQLAFLHDSLNFAATYSTPPYEARAVRHSRKPRYAAVDIALKLEEVLRDKGRDEAADSVEVLIAAYGQRFNSLIRGLGHATFESPPYSSRVVIRRFDIPNEHEAEDKIIY